MLSKVDDIKQRMVEAGFAGDIVAYCENLENKIKRLRAELHDTQILADQRNSYRGALHDKIAECDELKKELAANSTLQPEILEWIKSRPAESEHIKAIVEENEKLRKELDFMKAATCVGFSDPRLDGMPSRKLIDDMVYCLEQASFGLPNPNGHSDQAEIDAENSLKWLRRMCDAGGES
jgi:hypothetical protein